MASSQKGKQMTKVLGPITKTLRKARMKIAKGWCRHALGVDANGNQCPVYEAKKVCVIGALQFVAPDDEEHRRACADFLENLLPSRYHGGGLSAYNDVRGRLQSQMLGLFDRGIAAALAAGL
jgi:hypothetical protein